jgi:hypothetical protein
MIEEVERVELDFSGMKSAGEFRQNSIPLFLAPTIYYDVDLKT